MRLSEERTMHLAHKTADALKPYFPATDATALLTLVKQAFREFDQKLTEIEAFATQRIASLKRNVPEGSREWDILYRQYFEEKLRQLF